MRWERERGRERRGEIEPGKSVVGRIMSRDIPRDMQERKGELQPD